MQDTGYFLDSPDRFIAHDLLKFGTKIAMPGDIVVTTKGNSTGRIGVIREAQAGAVYSPHLSYWRSLDEGRLHQSFLYYWSLGEEFQRQLRGLAHGTDMAPCLSLRDQASLRISLPDITIQQSIAEVLEALDDKIELNRRMNETLEAMARALFKDWFVDFGPTRAKQEGREPYLAPELWSQFPERLDTEGKPEGWQEKPLDEIADFLNGLALQKYPALDPGDSLPVIKIAELRNGVTAKSDRASRAVPGQYVVKDSDFLFSRLGSLLAKFWTEGEGALNQHLFKVTSTQYPKWLFAHWVYHHLEGFQTIAASKATTMGHIQRGHLQAAMTICPTDSVVQKHDAVLAPLIDRVIQNELASRTLAQTRDLLLPKLMSGEIRIAPVGRVSEA